MNYRPGIPRYLQIADSIRHELSDEGERIASEHALCARFKVSRPTVRQALDVLVQEGRLYRHAGRGTFATPAAGGDRKLRVIGSVGDMMALGDETWFKFVSREVVLLPANIAQALRLPPRSSAYCIVGVRHAETGPFQHVTAYMPLTIGTALSDEDLSKTSLIGAIERVLGVPIKLMEQVGGRRARAAPGRRAPADPRPVTAALLRAHVLRAERRARRARHQLADRPPLSVPDRPLPGGAPELTGASPPRTADGYRVGFDVGGTFTDFVLQSPSGELTTGKRLTTYPDPSEACLAGLDALLAQGGVSWADVAQAVHGTTLGSNVVIERKARGVGLLTTRGFRDVLIIGREKRYQVYDLQIEKPPSLIPRRLIGEVTERVLADGTVRTPLDEADARRAIRELAARGVTTLAVCLLHAYLNPAHERRIAALAAEVAPHVTVTLSHEVSPTFREYERTSTTVVNAYVMATVREYLRALGDGHGPAGLSRPALRDAILRRHCDRRGDAAISRPDDRVRPRRRRLDGGRVRGAGRPPRPHRLRHGRHHRQARAHRAGPARARRRRSSSTA